LETTTLTITEAPSQTLDAMAGWVVMMGAAEVTLNTTLAVPEQPLVVPVTE
jgi:hypothetical protein